MSSMSYLEIIEEIRATREKLAQLEEAARMRKPHALQLTGYFHLTGEKEPTLQFTPSLNVNLYPANIAGPLMGNLFHQPDYKKNLVGESWYYLGPMKVTFETWNPDAVK